MSCHVIAYSWYVFGFVYVGVNYENFYSLGQMKDNFISQSAVRFKEERERLGMVDQATAGSLCGVSREMWGKYERGKSVPGGEVLFSFAAQGADVQYILTGIRSQKEAESNGKSDRLSLLDECAQKDDQTPSFAGSNHLLLADTEQAGYALQDDLTPREKALLDNYRNIPDKEDQGVIEKMALIAARAAKDGDQTTGTEKKAVGEKRAG